MFNELEVRGLVTSSVVPMGRAYRDLRDLISWGGAMLFAGGLGIGVSRRLGCPGVVGVFVSEA